MSVQSRRWCFTLNNYSSYDEDDLSRLESKFLIYGKEHCPTTGTPHLQGFVVFAAPKKLAAVKKIHPTAHWEVAKGTTAQNVTYCSKADPAPFLKGVQPKDRVQQAADQKAHYADVIRSAKEGSCESEYPSEFLRYYNVINKLYRPKLADLDEYSAYWYVGPPGSGKSRSARARYPGLYNKLLNKWWDGYEHEEVVLLDDFSKSNVMTGDALKNWADHYPFRAETKGSSMMIRPKVIIVTSNYEIAQLWPDDPVLVAALTRRFKVVRFHAEFPWNP